MYNKTILELTYHELARRLLLHQDTAQIAKDMNLSIDSVELLMRKDSFQEVLARLRNSMYADLDKDMAADATSIRARIHEAADRSMTVLEDLLKQVDLSAALKVNIAQDFLDRDGHFKQPSAAATVSININPIDASVIVTALQKEAQGEALLAKKGELAKSPADLDNHPLVQSQRSTPGSENKGS